MEKEEQKAPVEQSAETSGKSDEKKDFVAYESYSKVLSEKKSTQAKAKELEEELKALREEKMAREGRIEELSEQFKKERDLAQEEVKKMRNNYAWNSLTSTFKSVAKKHNCKDPADLLKVIRDEDLRSIEVGENFEVNTDSIDQVISKYKQEKSYLFDADKKKMANGNPAPSSNGTVDFSKLSSTELEERFKKL